jgi:transposase
MMTGLSELDERLHIQSFDQREGRLAVYATLVSKEAPCPDCGKSSTHRHSTYERVWTDVPDGGRPVVVHLKVQKWFCRTPSCPRCIFAERLEWLRPNKRKSQRLEAQIRELAFMMSAVQTAHACRHLGIEVSHDYVLRIVYQTELPSADSPFRRHR